MSILDTIKTGETKRPRRTVLYGVHGIGKSTWAAAWPSPVFVPLEDGISDLDVASFPVFRELGPAYQAIIELGGESEHPFKTVVIDSADWLERLIWRKVCESEGKKAITDFGYGSGYGKSAAIFADILKGLDACRARGMHVVVLAHSEVKRFESPEGDSYDRYVPKLHRDTSALLQEWADEVLFSCYKVNVRKASEGFNKERGVGIGSGERVIKTTERPSHIAKNRLGLPDEIPLNFAESYRQYID